MMRAMPMVFQRDLFSNDPNCFNGPSMDSISRYHIEQRWPLSIGDFEKSPIQLLHHRALRLDRTNPLGEKVTAHFENCDFGFGNCTTNPFIPTHIIVNRFHDYLRPTNINANGLRSDLYPLLTRLRELYPESTILFHGTFQALNVRSRSVQRAKLRNCERLANADKYRVAEWVALREVNAWILRKRVQELNSLGKKRSEEKLWRPILYVSMNSLVTTLRNSQAHSSMYGGDSLHYNPYVAEKMGRVVLRHVTHNALEQLVERTDSETI